MQPKFTRKNFGSLTRIIVLLMVFVLSGQVSFVQAQSDKERMVNGPTDASLSPQGTGQVTQGISTMSSIRTRGSASERPLAPTPISTTGFLNNNANATISFNFRNTNSFDVKIIGIESICDHSGSTDVSVYYKTSAINGAPGALTAGNGWNQFGAATIAAVGNQTGTTPQPFLSGLSLVVPAGATYGIVVQAVDAGTTAFNLRYSTIAAGTYTFSNGGCDVVTGTSIGYGGVAVPGAPTFTPRGFMGTVIFDRATCDPVNATAPTISSIPSSTCAGSPITLSVIGGSLNGAAAWQWYTGSCGGTPVGSGNSITVSPGATTTYYVRGEGGCAPAPGPCATQTVTVSSCTCLTPDVATICAGSIQKLSVTPTGASTQTFNGGAITIPAGAPTTTGGVASPYPSSIAVAGLPTGGVYVNAIRLNGMSHTFPSDLDLVLVSPTGQRVVFMSDAGGGTDIVGVNLVFSDAAAAILPAVITSGTYKPTNTGGPDNFPAPGPGSVTNIGPTLSSFTGNPNGNWNLYIFDQFLGDVGSITSWSIEFRIVPTAVWTPVATLFSNAAATIPYVAGTETDVVWAQPSATTTYTATISAGPCAGANDVTVTVLPRPNVTITPATGGCSPITLTAAGAVNYSWSPGSGLNTTTGPTVIATTPTNATYTVLGYGANGCSNTATVPVNGISTAAVISAPPAFQSLINEGFEGTTLPSGWNMQNLSSPIGTVPNWVFGATVLSPAQSGTANSYALGNFNNVAGNNTISNWLISPPATMQNGDVVSFWSRTVAGPLFPDRLEVRLSTNGTSTNVGNTNTSVGDFTTLLLTINPNLTTSGYPSTWTNFTATISGLPGPTQGRIAFRYYVTGGGPSGANSDNVGVDNVQVNRPLAGVCANTVSTMSVAITGGQAPYTLVYTNGTTNTTFTNYTSGTPIQVSPSVTTTYTIVSVTGANGCPGVGNSGAAVINVTPPPAITTQPANKTACDGGNTTFTVAATPVTGNNFQWQVSTNGGGSYTNIADGGVYGGATTSTLTLTGVTSAMNNYRYRVVINGACPPTPITSGSATLTVNVPPVITTDPANTTRCVGTTATFNVAATANGPTYQWQVSSDGGTTWTNVSGATLGTLSLSNITLAMNNNRYRAIVTVAPCAIADTSAAATLSVNALPVVTIASPVLLITPGQTATITATSNPAAQNANSYSWTLNGDPVDPVVNTNPLTVNIDGLGTYQATVTDINGCVGTSNELVIGGAQSDRLWIYPNPTSGQFQVRLYSTGNPTEVRVVSLFSPTGQLLERKKFTLTNVNGPYLRMDFDLSKAAVGTYLVKVEDRFSNVITSGFVVKQ